MKKFTKVVLFIAASNLLLMWIAWGLFMATSQKLTVWQFLGLAPSSPPSYWQNSVGVLLGVLSSPMSWLLTNMKNTFVLVTFSILNSFIWGLCIGFPIYILKQKRRGTSPPTPII
jgi:hypothetical protein